MKQTTLMQIGKASVVQTTYEGGDIAGCLDLRWTEVQQDSWYGNEEVEEEIDKEVAIMLIEVLTKHFDL